MTTAELIQQCEARIAKYKELGLTSEGCISLVVPGRATGNTKRLCGRHGPRGEVVADLEDDKTLVAFNCKQVIAWAKKHLTVENET